MQTIFFLLNNVWIITLCVKSLYLTTAWSSQLSKFEFETGKDERWNLCERENSKKEIKKNTAEGIKKTELNKLKITLSLSMCNAGLLHTRLTKPHKAPLPCISPHRGYYLHTSLPSPPRKLPPHHVTLCYPPILLYPQAVLFGRAVSEVKLGPSQPWEAVMVKAQTQTHQVCQSDSFCWAHTVDKIKKNWCGCSSFKRDKMHLVKSTQQTKSIIWTIKMFWHWSNATT